MNTVSTLEATDKLSELIAAAGAGGPQIITNNGMGTAVLISYDDYRRLTARKKSLVEFLLESPLSGSDLDLTRAKDEAGRATLNFDEEAE
ncbi:MAG: type II toxin-antitoxin system Phd/YefM family antitoxin [Acidobacteria bacterium]|nr:type II toxin-antitoxin system Phd/YefM family antitoxin [Acidobacteriota bacterium]